MSRIEELDPIELKRTEEKGIVEQIKSDLDSLGGYGSLGVRAETEKLKDRIAKQEGVKPNEKDIHVAPQVSAKAMLEISGFEKRGGIYEELKDKKVVDIGGGFGGLPFEVSSSVKELVVVDPLFSAEDLDGMLENDISELRNLISKNLALLQTVEEERLEVYNELDRYFEYTVTNVSSKETEAQLQERANNLSHRKRLIEKNRKAKTFVLSQLKQRRKGLPSNVFLNGSLGEDIKGVKQSAYDMVFINHVLDKPEVSSIKVLSQALDLLTPEGEVVIVDDGMDDTLKRVVEVYGIKVEQKGTSFVCRIRKKDVVFDDKSFAEHVNKNFSV